MKLKGKRINVRKLKRSDAESIRANIKDKEISIFTLIPHPYKLQHAKDFIQLTHRKMRKKEGYELGIELKETGEIIGGIGLKTVDPVNKKAELGYWVGKKYWGQGICSEAVGLILEFAFKTLKLKKVFAYVASPNKASARVLKKVGFKQEGHLRRDVYRNQQWMDRLVFGILRSEYKR